MSAKFYYPFAGLVLEKWCEEGSGFVGELRKDCMSMNGFSTVWLCGFYVFLSFIVWKHYLGMNYCVCVPEVSCGPEVSERVS